MTAVDPLLAMYLVVLRAWVGRARKSVYFLFVSRRPVPAGAKKKMKLCLLFLFVSFGIVSGLFSLNTQNIRGVNWADARDNYNSGWVIPSGLESFDDYSTVKAKAINILSGFQSSLGANTVRLPINPQSVFESWWGSYSAAFDAAVERGMNVVIGYWESETKDGRVDDLDEFWTMWKIVTDRYLSASSVHFEIFNEPFGYSATEWTNLAAEFLAKFPNVPQNRVIVSGTGYNDNLIAVGQDARLKNCLLSLHIYPYWNPNSVTETAWRIDFKNRVGEFFPRAIVSEYGTPMTTGLNYTGPINNNNNIAFMYGVPDQILDYSMGSIYWPGLRDGDSYSITNRGGSGVNITLSVTNPSGLERIRHGWGK